MSRVKWQPLPGSQASVICCPADEILYHGTRGPGKTEAQLAFYVARCGIGYGTHWTGIIFDRSYKNLDDVVKKSKAMIPQIFPDARFLSSKSDMRWIFPDGESLLFRHIDKPSDYYNYHGHEYSFIGWNELTKFPTSEIYDMMASCNRSSFLPLEHSPGLTEDERDLARERIRKNKTVPKEITAKLLPDIPLVTLSTTNPYGPGHNWVKKRWIDRAPPGTLIRKKTRVFNPRTSQDEDIVTTSVHIFGTYKENKYLDPKYVATLDAITDPNKRKAWLGGDWSITAGGALDDIWKAETHVLPRFIVPTNWTIKRSFDWGSSHPFSVGYWAIANGESVKLPNGQEFAPPRGSLIRVGEVYGAERGMQPNGFYGFNYGTNKGIKASARDVARMILEYEEDMLADGWFTSKPEAGPADGQIYNVNEKESGSIAARMEEEGVTFYPADKSRGTRKNGLELIRVALENSRMGEGPGLYVMDHCESFIETVPGIPRDEKDMDDVDTTSEDHVYDEVRYMVLDEKPQFATSVNVGFVH